MKEIRLYNIIFPIWLLWLVPTTWFVVLPANFLIDLLVVVVAMKCLKVSEIKQKAKSVILKVWIMGFVADFIGTALMFVSNFMELVLEEEAAEWWYKYIVNAVSYNPFENPFSFLWVTVCTVITAVLIYVINAKWCLKKAELSEKQNKRVALALSVFTAPYLFYLPTEWFF